MQCAFNTVTCSTCSAVFRVDADEDGLPELPGEFCADPSCGKKLCPVCLDHFGFHCDGCGHHFCLEHQAEVYDGTDRPLRLCPACMQYVEPVPIPELKPIPVTVARPDIPEWTGGEAA